METAPPPAPADPTPARHRPTPTLLIVVIFILALVVAALGGALVASGSSDSNPSSDAAKRDGELFLEPADALGPRPFATRTRPASVSVAAATLSTPKAAAGIASIPGAREALYGGTLETASCDTERLVRFLEQHPDKAAAWARVQGIRPERIRAYVGSLTSVVLLRDTRVNNHGFSRGRATPRQAVLQRGTAVLVDEFGVPRARCYCGNPLTPPVALAAPVEIGPRWTGYEPTAVIVVIATVEVPTFVLVDIDTGEEFARPVGTDGDDDVPVLEDGDAGPGPSTDATGGDSNPPAATPSGTYTVEFSGEQLSPCTMWGAGTGSMEVTVAGASVGITLLGLGGTTTDYAGGYDPATGAFSAPDVRYGATVLTGTFQSVDGGFTVPDGRSNGHSATGVPCIGAFTATQTLG